MYAVERVSVAALSAVFVCCLASYFVRGDAGDAMDICQLSNSHDVCFQALNR